MLDEAQPSYRYPCAVFTLNQSSRAFIFVVRFFAVAKDAATASIDRARPFRRLIRDPAALESGKPDRVENPVLHQSRIAPAFWLWRRPAGISRRRSDCRAAYWRHWSARSMPVDCRPALGAFRLPIGSARRGYAGPRARPRRTPCSTEW